MFDRIDRSLDRNWLALFLSPFAALFAFALIAVALESPPELAEWPASLADVGAGMLLYGWYLLPLPFLLVYGLEALFRAERTSLLVLPASRVIALGVALGWLTMVTLSWTVWPGAGGRGPALGAAIGFVAAVVIVVLRVPRAAS